MLIAWRCIDWLMLIPVSGMPGSGRHVVSKVYLCCSCAIIHTSVQVQAHSLITSLSFAASLLVRLSGKCHQLLQAFPAIGTVLHDLLSVSQLSRLVSILTCELCDALPEHIGMHHRLYTLASGRGITWWQLLMYARQHEEFACCR